VKIIGPLTLEGREGIVSFNLDGMASPDLVQEFAKRGIRVHARVSDGYSGHILGALGLDDCLRVSMCHYNSPEEVRQFLGALAEIRQGR
jgi:cysteine desulfurase/selenocysteine lyase